MSTATTSAARSRTGKPLFTIAILLFTVLGLLFARSFFPDYVHFSNDGPLGQQNTDCSKLPDSIFGGWADLNTIGFNYGGFPPSIATLIRWSLGPLGYSKFLAPIALFILGLGAWTFFRQLKLSPLAATLGALAAALNSSFFADACWGTASHQIAFGMDFFALALIVSNSAETPALLRWTRLALAGLAVGINVMEALDIGALFSLFIAGFAFFRSMVETGDAIYVRAARGIGRVALIAVFAAFIAAQTVVSMVSTQIQGIAGTSQDAATKAAQWDFATQWSQPKKETLGIFVPGLFGYRMDTPLNMMPFLQNTYQNGVYWGGGGRTPAIDRFFDSGGRGNPPPGGMRFGSGSNYCGVLVVLTALWSIVQSFRRQNPLFSPLQKKFIWFWSTVFVISLLLAWGRFAPMFYGTLYQLPYFSTIRNPGKFFSFSTWAMIVLFAYGVDALSRRYLISTGKPAIGINVQLKNWWRKADGLDRKWIFITVAIFIISLLGWLIYGWQKPAFIQYLQKVGFPDENFAAAIADFSLGQVEWFLVLLAIVSLLLTLVIAGYFSGSRARLGGILLGAFLIFDLGRANLPWIIHWDYKQKYEIGTLNPVETFLRQQPYEHRVAMLPFESQQPLRDYDNYFGGQGGLYNIEWAQHHFPYYNIQSLDIIQMPRKPADLQAFDTALAFGTPLRRWELTNTRYLLGPAGFLMPLNEQLDPAKQRFRIALRFDVLPKPDVTKLTGTEQLTALTNNDGDLALFDFTGALPRAKLYSNWQIAKADPNALQAWAKNIAQQVPSEMGDSLIQCSTNDQATLHEMVSTNFDPWATVLVNQTLPTPSEATNDNSGTVEFKSYAPKDIMLAAKSAAPSVLLLNDKYDPHWSVSVDGKPAELLRCNFIMRGVYLTPGEHTVEFQFKLPDGPLYITLIAIGIGILLSGLLFFLTRKPQPSTAG